VSRRPKPNFASNCKGIPVSVFYRILQGNLDLSKFGLQDVPWKNRIRIYSFVFNTWSTDQRPLQERLRSPKILDIGITEIGRETFRPKDEIGASLHIVLSINRRFGQRVERMVSGSGMIRPFRSHHVSLRPLIMVLQKPLIRKHLHLNFELSSLTNKKQRNP
jgi:hypothetical protein